MDNYKKRIICLFALCLMVLHLIACGEIKKNTIVSNNKLESHTDNKNNYWVTKIIDYDIRNIIDAKIVNNKLWFILGWKKGIHRLNLNTKEVKYYDNDVKLNENIGYYNAISHFDDNIWFYPKHLIYSDPKVSQAVLRYDISKNKFTKYLDGKPDIHINATIYDNNDVAWIGTHKGLFKLDLQTSEVGVINNEYINDIVGTNTDVFIGTSNNGIFKVNKKTYEKSNILKSKFILGLKLYNNNNHIFANIGNEDETAFFACYNIHKNSFKYYNEKDLIDENVQYIHIGKDNIGFITTKLNNKMLFYQFNFETEKFDKLETNYELNNNLIFDAIFLNQYFILGLDNGVLIYNKSSESYDIILKNIKAEKIVNINDSKLIVLSSEGIYSVLLK
ncbi:hypothetical protein PV797_09475 [Clostridiaceae bacterium M8S5]|nr:hypothetical protein PV797_09475 [Clostridiaceae bacterium M8S5]